jgi:hypothetical protein
MAALIDTVATTLPLGREGLLATTDPNHSMVTRCASAVVLNFGRAAIRGASDRLVVHPSGAAGVFMGLVIEDLSIPPILQATANTVPAGEDAGLMTAGLMWVVPEVNVTQGEAVYYRHASAGALPEALGRLRNDTDGGDATLIDGASWATSASAGGFAQVRLNTK